MAKVTGKSVLVTEVSSESSDIDYARGDELLTETLEAHGGIARWRAARRVQARLQVRGLMPTWKFPERPADDYRCVQTIDVQELRSEMEGFPRAGVRCIFTPQEMRVEFEGKIIDRREHARRAFRGVGALRRLVRWDTIDSAYFLSYAFSNYLAHPYRFTQPGFRVRRGKDWRGDGETWRRLEVQHPANFDSHCRNETFYIDEHGLIRRHDYIPDIFTEARLSGPFLPTKAAHFTSQHRNVDGLVFPTFRRVMLAPPGKRPVPGLTIICTQLSDLEVTFAPESGEVGANSRESGERRCPSVVRAD